MKEKQMHTAKTKVTTSPVKDMHDYNTGTQTEISEGESRFWPFVGPSSSCRNWDPHVFIISLTSAVRPAKRESLRKIVNRYLLNTSITTSSALHLHALQ